MKRKFAFIGAGSLDFTRGLVRDILTFDAFRDCEIMLMDINETRLKYAKDGVMRIVEAGRYPAVVHATTDRKEALKDADGVLITILQGGVEVWRHDMCWRYTRAIWHLSVFAYGTGSAGYHS